MNICRKDSKFDEIKLENMEEKNVLTEKTNMIPLQIQHECTNSTINL